MITDKDAKEWQKMLEKLEKQSKKDKKKQQLEVEKKDNKVLDKPDQVWYNSTMNQINLSHWFCLVKFYQSTER